MKIASLTNTPLDSSLGSGKTVIEWTSGLRAAGHDVEVFPPDTFYRPLPRQMAHRLKMRMDATRMAGRLLRSGYDLIEFYGGEFGWLAARLSSRAKRPLLVAHTNGLELLADRMTSTNADPTSLPKKLVSKIIRDCDLKAFKRVDRFVGICSLDTEYIVNSGILPRSNTATVETGIDREYLASNWARSKEHRIAYFGSWSDRKDPRTLIRVMTRLMDEDAELFFDVLGTHGAKDLVLSGFPMHLHQRIQVYQKLSIPEIVEVLERVKIFFFPSLYEGFGMATAQAIACGCAAVVTPTGFGGSLQTNIEAVVCPFRDESAFHRAIQTLLSNENARRAIAMSGRQRVAGMTWKKQVNLLERTYRAWLSEFRSAERASSQSNT